MTSIGEAWPEAPREGWLETAATLQLWSQVVGKVKLGLSPPENHWWHVALYPSLNGLTTGLIPYRDRIFQIDFDLKDHAISFETSDGGHDFLILNPMPMSHFHHDVLVTLKSLGIDVSIWPVPVEVADATPFTERVTVSEYRPEIAECLFRIFLTADMALKRFRGDFLGKQSPSHVFWGGLDLAMTRFSGRVAPPHPGGIPNLADWVTREAYSHEVWSAGFWPGSAGSFERPAFYAYAYPEPAGFATAPVEPSAAYYHPTLREFLLPYDEVRTLRDPAAAVAAFLRDTYRAAADNGDWPRATLERHA